MDDSSENGLGVRDPDMADDALGLGLEEMPGKSVVHESAASPYRVLARKYRPQNFAELIGQDAMVQTLGNAIKRGRLAHAFLMTGVRGVGKTSTARLIAKALNCVGPDGQGGPTIDPCGVCEPCRAIAEGRHIDVIEMDAASNTKVEQMRDLLDGIPYAAVTARYKMYIIDEVHMLSNSSFNAMLKTLEEPPAHVKFLFATTEVNKVPITVLSRCQRFDLKRISAEALAAHFAEICAKEGVSAEEEALRLIAQAAEGSVRDGLSILDQAIAHADLAADDSGTTAAVEAAQVRSMLGLSDRAAVRRLFGLLLEGNASAVLEEARNQYRLGVEPAATLSGLLREVHLVTLAKIGSPPEMTLPDDARQAIDDLAERLSFPMLHRLWQLLLKGQEEVRQASLPLECCDMALLRVVHGAAMPDPGELARLLQNGLADTVVAQSSQERTSQAETVSAAMQMPSDFRSLVEALDRGGHPNVAATLHDVVRIVEFAPPKLRYQLSGPVHQGFGADLNDALFRLTGERWDTGEAAGEAQPSLYEQEKAEQSTRDGAVLQSPLVQAALAAFPEAEVHVDGRTIFSPHEAEVRSLRA